MILSRQRVPLASIAGLSPLNPRQSADGDLNGLCASLAATGLLHPLLVHEDGEALLVLDGGRRWRALRALAAKDPTKHLMDVSADVVSEASEAEMRALALTANVNRRALHPVAEYEAFAALAEAGFTPERIAAEFGDTLRHVKQRLALGHLAPEIRAAWRGGLLTADAAKAFTAAETLAAQQALFAEMTAQGDYTLTPAAIRLRLIDDAISASAPEAIFLGVEAYCAAGGDIAEDLFDEAALWRDGALAKHLAQEKLTAEAEAIAEAEGWGSIVIGGNVRFFEHDFDSRCDEPDYLDEETLRIAAIDRERGQFLNEGLTRGGDQSDALDALDTETRAIEIKALLRTIPSAERGTLGLYAEIDRRGRAIFMRGLLPTSDSDAADHGTDGTREVPDSSPGASRETKPPKDKEPKPRKETHGNELHLILVKAIEGGLRSEIAGRPDFAMMIVAAGLANKTCDDFTPLVSDFDRGSAGADASALAHCASFDTAFMTLADRPQPDVISLFCRLVAASCEADTVCPLSDFFYLSRAFALRGAALGAAFAQHIDYDAYFKYATKDAALHAITACDGPGAASDAGKQKKDVWQKRAATLARDRRWLPEPLAGWAAIPPGAEAVTELPSGFLTPADKVRRELLADDAAAAQDSAADDAEPEPDASPTACFRFEAFLSRWCRRDLNAAEKSALLYEAYVDFCYERDKGEPVSQIAFGRALIGAGFTKETRKGAVYYCGLALGAAAEAAQ